MRLIKLRANTLPPEKRKRRFARLGTIAERMCPWCYQIAVAYKATKKRVQFWCPKQCGYRASVPKYDLKYEEKRKIYGRTARKKRKPLTIFICEKPKPQPMSHYLKNI